MNDAQAQARNAQFPHISLETIAYYEGRNAADRGGRCGFKASNLRAAFVQGVRSVQGENRLDADTEWDGESE